MESDQQEFAKILQKQKVNVDIDNCTRIGKITDGKQQLLRVKLKDYTQIMNLLNAVALLQNVMSTRTYTYHQIALNGSS